MFIACSLKHALPYVTTTSYWENGYNKTCQGNLGNTSLCFEVAQDKKKQQQQDMLVGFVWYFISLSGEPDYFGRNEISSGGDLSHYSSASLY